MTNTTFTWAGRETYSAKEYYDLMMYVLDLKFRIACISGIYEGMKNSSGDPLTEQEKAWRRDHTQAVALRLYKK